MKKSIISGIMAIALFASVSVMAQDLNKKATSSKTNTEAKAPKQEVKKDAKATKADVKKTEKATKVK